MSTEERCLSCLETFNAEQSCFRIVRWKILPLMRAVSELFSAELPVRNEPYSQLKFSALMSFDFFIADSYHQKVLTLSNKMKSIKLGMISFASQAISYETFLSFILEAKVRFKFHSNIFYALLAGYLCHSDFRTIFIRVFIIFVGESNCYSFLRGYSHFFV